MRTAVYQRIVAAFVVAGALGGGLPAAQAASTSTTFVSTGAEQTFTVPAGTTSVTVTAVAGNGAANTSPGGLGARVEGATLSVTPGQVLYLEVGGNASGTGGGFNGGGSGGSAGGGGATDLRTIGRSLPNSLASRLLVVPAGGGGSHMAGGNWESAGGDYSSPDCLSGGRAGTSAAGGAGGAGPCFGLGSAGAAGSLGTGGNGSSSGSGGGGGGGYYGGGGGGFLGGGGGGSGYLSSSVTNSPTFSNGDGSPRIVLTYEFDAAPVAVNDPKTVGEDSGATTIDVLANDTDSDGGTKKIESKTDGANGTVAITNSGADLTYTPNANYCNTQAGGAADTFTYTLNGNSTGTVSVTVNCSNDLPVVGLAATALAYTENDAATAVDGSATITDPDDASIESAEVKLTNPQSGDELSYATTNGIAGTVNGAKDTVTFSAAGARTDYEAALKAVKFRSTSDAPSTTQRSVRFKVNDGDGDSNLPTRAISVTPANDGPTVATTGAALAYNENDAATAVDAGAAVTDPDTANVASAQVTLTNPQAGDELSYATTNGVAGTVNGAKDTVTFSASATVANYQAALRAVKFRNTSDTPSTTARTVSFKANDGTADSNIPTRTVNVIAVNDAPALGPGGGNALSPVSIWGSSGSGNGQFSSPYNLTQDADGFIYVADFQNHRIQKFTAGGAFVTKWGSSGTGDGQFNGSFGIDVDSAGNVYVVDRYQARVQKFTSSGAFVRKWGTSGSGDGQFGIWMWGLAVDSSDNVYVVDQANSRIQKFTSDGQFIRKWGSSGAGDGQFNGPAGIEVDTAGNVYVTEWAGHRVQKFTSDGVFVRKWGSRGNADGQFSGPRGVAVDTNGDVLIADTDNHRIQKFDANGNFLSKTGSFGSGSGQLYGPAEVVVDAAGDLYVVEYGNHRVQKFSSGPAPLAYTEGDAAKQVLGTLTAADLDDSNLTGATVSITAGFKASEDELGFTNQNGISGSYNATTGVLTLTGTATVDQYRDALRTVTYRNSNNVSPSTTPRTITFRASDGGAGQGTAAARIVNVSAVNSAPTVSTTATPLSYSTGQAATAVDPGVAVADIDNPNLTGATVQITSGLNTAQDVLAFTAANGINGSYAANTGLLTLTGTATLAQYQSVLRSVTYRNTAAAPTTATRTVRFTVNDGATTGFGTRNIAVTATPVAPTVTTSSTAVSYTENGAPLAVDTALTVADPDSPSLASARVSISANSAEDGLAFANQNGIVGSYDSSTGVLTLTGVAARQNYETALRSVTYRNTSENPSTTARTVSFTVNDGTLNSVAATRQVNVVSVNDPPVVKTTAAPLAYTERSGAQVIDPGIAVSDVDSQVALADVQISGFTQAEDRLSFTPEPGLSATQPFAPGRWYTVLQNRQAASIYQSGLRGIKFTNTSANPSTQVRTISFAVSDGPSATRASRQIAITRVNDAPIASPNTYSVSETSTLAEAAPGVLRDDSDADGPSLSVGEVAGGATNVGVQQTTAKGAKVTINANGSLSYDPNGKFAALNAGDLATDTVTYRATDGTASSNLVTVTFTINGVGSAPVAVKDAYTVAENGTLNKAAPGVLENDSGTGLAVSQVDGSAAKVGAEQTTAKGAKVTVNANGSLSYDPNGRFEALDAGETATDSVSYSAFDGSQSAGPATVTFTIEGANDAPAAADDAYPVGEDARRTEPAAGVLANDTDADVEILAVGEVAGSAADVGTEVTTGKGAKFTLNPDGSFTYDPNGQFEDLDAGETRADSVAYRATDGDASSGAATITFNVNGANDAPVASGDSYTVGENATISPAAPGVLDNDSDVDVEPIVVGQVEGSAAKVGVEQTTARGAKVTINASGSLSYDPNGKFERLDTGESDTDSITYRASDSTANGPSGKVTFTVNGANDAPVGVAESYDVAQNGVLSIPAAGVLGNDTDVDVEPITVGEVQGSAGGVDSDVRSAKDAKVKIGADGALTYDPEGRFSLLDSGEQEDDTFTYRASDGDESTAPVTVTVTVYGSNDVPTAVPDQYSVGENGTLGISADGLVGNDGDVDIEGLTVAELDGSAAKVGSEQLTANGAKVTVNAPGSLNYDPNGKFEALDDGETGTDSFTYKVTDGTDQSVDAGTVTITVIGSNDAPAAPGNAYSVGENATLAQVAPGVLGNLVDVDVETATVTELAGEAASVGLEQPTAKGAKVTLSADGSLGYDPNGKFEALDIGETDTDSFVFKASDGSASSETATVTITIQGSNDAPAGGADSYSVGENGTLTQAAAGVLANDSDVDVESLSVGEVGGASGNVGNEQATAKGGKATLNSDGSLSYDPNGGFEQLDSGESDSDSIDYKPSDGSASGDSTPVTFAVNGENDAPVAVDDARSVGESSVLIVDAAGVLGNDTDPDVEALTVDQVAGAAGDVGVQRTTAKGAKLTVNADGSIVYDPNGRFASLTSGQSDTDSVAYRASDGDASSAPATLTVTINGANDRPVVTPTSAALAFGEGDAPKAADGGLTLADVDDTTLQSAQVKLTDPQTGDELSYATTAGVTGTVNGAKDTVSLSTAGSKDDYRDALRAVKFFNGSDDASGADRHISFEVNDGDVDSELGSRTVDFTAVNDIPTVANTAAPLSYTEGDAPTAIDPGSTVADADDASIESARVKIANAQGGDVLSYSETGGVTGALNAAKDTLTLGGSRSKADYRAALRAVEFSNTRNDPSLVDRTISFEVNDGDASSSPSSRTVAMVARTPSNTTPPLPVAPAIVGRPAARTAVTSATFSFTGAPGARFQCRLDSRVFQPCTSPVTYRGLDQGRHSFRVRQLDAQRRKGPAVRVIWTIVTVPAGVDATVPGGDGTQMSDNGAFGAGCKLDRGSLSSCETDAYTQVPAAGGAQAAKTRRVKIGEGRRAFARRGTRQATVRVELSRRGRALLRSRPRGMRVVFEVAARTYGSRQVLRDRGRVTILARVARLVPAFGFFPADSAELGQRQRRYLRRLRPVLLRAEAIRCEGHTSTAATRTEESLRQLGMRRAEVACAYLREIGVRARYTTRSYGSTRPRATNRTRRGRDLNQRVELRITR
jgi:VCBS repeat-containing protein